MVRVPDSYQQKGVGNAIQRKDFQRVSGWQETVSIKSNQQYRTYPNELPAQKQHFKVTGKNDERESYKEQQNRVIKSFKALFAVHVELAEDENKGCHDRSYSQENRSEEHTSELQSQSNLVCRLLLEKKKKKKY